MSERIEHQIRFPWQSKDCPPIEVALNPKELNLFAGPDGSGASEALWLLANLDHSADFDRVLFIACDATAESVSGPFEGNDRLRAYPVTFHPATANSPVTLKSKDEIRKDIRSGTPTAIENVRLYNTLGTRMDLANMGEMKSSSLHELGRLSALKQVAAYADERTLVLIDSPEALADDRGQPSFFNALIQAAEQKGATTVMATGSAHLLQQAFAENVSVFCRSGSIARTWSPQTETFAGDTDDLKAPATESYFCQRVSAAAEGRTDYPATLEEAFNNRLGMAGRSILRSLTLCNQQNMPDLPDNSSEGNASTPEAN